MAEIKSTLDIIMEKTRHLVLSPEERRQVERDEELRKVPGYVQKLLDNVWELDDLQRAVANLPEGYSPEVQQELVRCLVKELDFQGRGRRCLEALERLADSEGQRKLRECQELMGRFDEAHQKMVTADTERSLARLAALGISGSAVLVRGEKDHQWEDLRRDYGCRLQALKSTW
jgi:hypothetical protein